VHNNANKKREEIFLPQVVFIQADSLVLFNCFGLVQIHLRAFNCYKFIYCGCLLLIF